MKLPDEEIFHIADSHRSNSFNHELKSWHKGPISMQRGLQRDRNDKIQLQKRCIGWLKNFSRCRLKGHFQWTHATQFFISMFQSDITQIFFLFLVLQAILKTPFSPYSHPTPATIAFLCVVDGWTGVGWVGVWEKKVAGCFPNRQ